MKKSILFLLPILLLSSVITAQNFEWAKGMGGFTDDGGMGVAVDASGNVYTTGWFSTTADFDPGPDTFNLVYVGLRDVFIQKLDIRGNLLWVKQIGGARDDGGFSIAVDDSGNVYTTGLFEETADFDPGPDIYNLTALGSWDIFIQKLDTDGNFVWAKSMGEAASDGGYDIAVDDSGNVYTTGFFQGSVDFDPGAGAYYLFAENLDDVFIQKLDTDGNFIWARSMGGEGWDQGESIAVDDSGNVYTTGTFYHIADFDPGPDTFNIISASRGRKDIFVQKLDSEGDFLWAKSMGGTRQDRGLALTVDNSGNVYTTGDFSLTVDFDPGPDTFNIRATATYDIFIQKLDTDGNFIWAKNMGGVGGGNGGFSIAVDDSANIYTTGTFWATVDFDPGVGVYNLTSKEGWNIFIHKLDIDGNFCWAKAMGNEVGGGDIGTDIKVDDDGDVYTIGHFWETVDFDPNPGVYKLTAAGSRDFFVLKLSRSGNVAISNPLQSKIKLYPNPNKGLFHIELPAGSKHAQINIVNTLGKLVYHSQLKQIKNEIDLSRLSDGIYYIDLVLDTGEKFSGKVMLRR